MPLPLCLLLCCCGAAAVVLLFAVVAPGACWSHAGAMLEPCTTAHTALLGGGMSVGDHSSSGPGQGEVASYFYHQQQQPWRKKSGDLRHSSVSHYPFIFGSLECPVPVSYVINNVDIFTFYENLYNMPKYITELRNKPSVRSSCVPTFCASIFSVPL